MLRSLKPQVMAVFALTSLDQVLTIEQPSATSTPTKTLSSDNHLPMTHPSVQSWVKRLIDIVGAIVGLMITGILLVPIAAAITVNDPGPIFFGQTRCGWMGQQFRIWKFRSMCTNAESMKAQITNQASGAFFKNDNDPRITKVGRILRKSRDGKRGQASRQQPHGLAHHHSPLEILLIIALRSNPRGGGCKVTAPFRS